MAVLSIESLDQSTRLEALPLARLFYAEEGVRFAMYEPLSDYDHWGWSADGTHRWEHSFCVVDDYGDAIPVDPANHYSEGYQQCWSPDYSNPPPAGETYKYKMHYPTVH